MKPEGTPDIFSAPDPKLLVAPSKSDVWEAVKASALVSSPGAERRYSDAGFIVLGRVLEQAFKQLHPECDLSSLFEMYVARDIGLTNTTYRPIPTETNRAIAPTGLVRPRPPAAGQEGLFPHANGGMQPEAPGIVDDDNAYALGGVAGHAGLFSTAFDVAKYGDWICNMLLSAEGPPVGLILRHLCSEDVGPSGPKRTLGFDLPTPPNSSVGDKFGAGPKGAIGHLGFTGCSLWIDLDREITVALLTNRVFPDRGNATEISKLRRAVHTVIATEFPILADGA
jgi:CubicO group peptidase (beta-lactamase class C family)